MGFSPPKSCRQGRGHHLGSMSPSRGATRETLENATNCFASSDNGTGLTAEFPFGADTSMLMIKADERHQSLGSGIGMFLHLPIRTTRDDAADWARALNQMEAHETSGSLGHQLRCVGRDKSFSGSSLCFPAFASFLPAFVYRPLLLTNLAHALASRAHELGRWISSVRAERAGQAVCRWSSTDGFATHCHVEGLSQREAAQRSGIHRSSMHKMLTFSVPPGDRRTEHLQHCGLERLDHRVRGHAEEHRQRSVRAA